MKCISIGVLIFTMAIAGVAYGDINPYARVTALAIDPSTPSTLYAGTYGCGVFWSPNSGANWSAINTGLTRLPINALAIDPSTPSTLYAAIEADGVFQSTDSGGSWSAANTGLTSPATYVKALAIDPSAPSTLYAGSLSGVFKSTDSGASWNATSLKDPAVWALAIDPSMPSTLYAGSYGLGVFKSTDSGATWNGVSSVNTGFTESGSTYIFALAIDPTTPSTLYAGTYIGVLKSTDSGASWSGVLWEHVESLAIDPSAPSTLYAGTRDGIVFQSSDSGASWASAGMPGYSPVAYPDTFPAWVEALAIDPSTPSTLYAGTSGGIGVAEGVFKSTDSGASWSAVTTGMLCPATPVRSPTPAGIPGGENGSLVAWFTDPPAPTGRNGLPIHRLTCVDDNPQCDFGATTGDNACTFHVGLCLNMAGASGVTRATADTAQVRLLSPDEAKPKDGAATASRDALENALSSIGGAVRGLCASGPHKGELCITNTDCDSAAGSGNGLCKGRFVVFAEPSSGQNACTEFVPIQVPLRQTTRGLKAASTTLKVNAVPSVGRKGHHSLKLTCKPHP